MTQQDLSTLLNPRPRGAAVLWLAIMCCLLAAAYAGWQAQSKWEDVELRRRLIVQEEIRRRVPLQPPKPSRAELEIHQRWASLQAERSFSWYPIFRALEQSANPDVELLEFLPDKAGRRVVLRGEARDVTAMTNFLSEVSSQPGFHEVHLAHQKSVGRNGLTVVAFEIRARI